MKDAEDEAFDDLARKQGMWGGGFHAKRAAAADKLLEDQIIYGTSWSKNGERIDPASVYLEVPAQWPMPTVEIEYTLSVADIKEALAQPAQEDEEVCSHCGSYCHERTEQEQPLPPVEIGVDVTADGASVVAFYRRPNAVMEMFYSQFHPAPKRPWVGLTDEEIAQGNKESWVDKQAWQSAVWWAEAKLKEKNT